MNNKEYWEKRSLAMMKKIYNNQDHKNKILINNYESFLKELKNDLSSLYEKMDTISLSDSYKYDRYNKFVSQMEKRVFDLAKDEVNFDKKSLIAAYEQAYKDVSIGLGLKFDKLNIKAIEKAILYPWSGSSFSDDVWKNTNDLVIALKKVVTKGLVDGSSYINISRELNKIVYGKDLKGGYCYKSLRLIRTETAHIVNQATLDRYENSGVVEKIRILAAEDERTCDVCGEEHNKEYKLGYEPMLPLHAQCRCCYAPVIED